MKKKSGRTVNESIIGDFCILASNNLINNEAKVGSFSRVDCGGIVLKGKTVPKPHGLRVEKYSE